MQQVSLNGTRAANNRAQHHLNGTAPDATTGAQTFTFSRFNSKRDNSPKPVSLDWRGVCDLLSKRRETATDDDRAKNGAAIGGASYPDGAERGNANVSSVSLAILDFDDGTILEEIEAAISRLNSGDGAAAFIYSTFSHTPETPKFRVVIPLASPVAALDWPDVWKRLALAFYGAPDVKAKDAARLHFLPSCPKSRVCDAVAVEIGGDFLDVATLPALPKPAPVEPPQRPAAPNIGAASGDPYARKAFDNEIERLRSTTGNRNDALNKAALAIGHFVGAGRVNRSDAENQLLDAAHANGYTAKDGEKSARDTIKSGLDAGEREPNYNGLPNERNGQTSAPNGDRQRDGSDPTPEDEKPEEFEVFSFADLAILPRPKWLVRGLLVESTISVLTADGGSFKSFFALELALSIATGTDFHGREVKRGAVVYVAAEGFYTVFERALAWSQVRGVPLPENFQVLRAPVNVSEPSQVAKFARQFKDLAPAFAVLDTLSQNALGLNENANDEMARFMSGMAAVGVAIGSHVMAVHHNSKSTGTFRGAGAIKNNVDAHISLDRPEADETNTVFVRCEKQRGKPFDAFALRGDVIDTGEVDEFGDAITSLVFEATGDEVAPKSAHPNAARADVTSDRLLKMFDDLTRETPDGVKVGTWAGRAIKTGENPDGICSSGTFWGRLKIFKGEDVKCSEPKIEQCGWHGNAEIWKRCEVTPTTPTTPNGVNCSNGQNSLPTHSNNSNNPLGVGVVGVDGDGARNEKKSTRQKKANSNAESEPYQAAHTGDDERERGEL